MSRSSRSSKVLILVLAVALTASACSSDGDGEAGERSTTTSVGATGGGAAADGTYEATIRRTSYGIPHITGATFGDLGFGQGYAFAEDHLCTLADQIVKVRSERSQWFGPGEDGANLDSDFAYLSLGIRERAEADLDGQPAEVVDIVTGYAAGYNAYLAETGVDAVPGWCQGAEWVAPITALDLFTYYRDLALFASGQAVLDFIATAQPPEAEGATAATPEGETATTEAAFRLPDMPQGDLASNGWAVGGDRSVSGGGMVLANPHFPWYGEKRLWESHLTIPGELNVYGASLLGAPGVQIGFNDHVAWTHTVSAGNRFTGYRLSLVEGSPTTYRYGDEERAMTSETFTVDVLGDDGEVEPTERTMWSSHYGPIVEVPGLDWSASVAYSYRDANIENDELLAQFLGMNSATDLDEFQDVFRDVGGIPWVNTMAADVTGRAWFADGSATPNLSDATIAGWESALETDPVTGIAYDSGLVLLDGSDPANEWVAVDGARDPGLVPFRDQPQLERNDYVFNANDPHWIANPAAPLEGFSPLVGQEREQLSLRTRQNIAELEGTAKLSGDDLLAALADATSMSATVLLDDVVEGCTGAPITSLLGQACVVLSRWDGTFTADSAGAVLWRELRTNLPEGFLGGGPDARWAVPFDPAEPATTPSGLGTCPEDDGCRNVVNEAITAVAEAMGAADLALDVTIGDLQYALKDGERIVVPGGNGGEGVLSVVSTGGSGQGSTLDEPLADGDDVTGLENAGLTTEGYRIVSGTSFVMAVEFTSDGPSAQGLLTYSQSDDPAAGHDRDQTDLYAKQAWRPMLFTDEAIDADPELRTYTVTG